jgi:osmotically-inducible protein OsmY
MMKVLAAGIATLVIASGCSVIRGQETTGEYADDAALTARVKAALLDDEKVAGTHFNVDVNEGKVRLTGTAKNSDEKHRAESIAKQVPGVKGVDSDIQIAQASH